MLWQMSQVEWLQSFAFIACMAYLVGWFSDRILGYIGFGHIGNWLVLLSGAYLGLYIYNLKGYRIEADPMLSLGVLLVSGFFALAVLAGLKSQIIR